MKVIPHEFQSWACILLTRALALGTLRFHVRSFTTLRPHGYKSSHIVRSHIGHSGWKPQLTTPTPPANSATSLPNHVSEFVLHIQPSQAFRWLQPPANTWLQCMKNPKRKLPHWILPKFKLLCMFGVVCYTAVTTGEKSTTRCSAQQFGWAIGEGDQRIKHVVEKFKNTKDRDDL